MMTGNFEFVFKSKKVRKKGSRASQQLVVNVADARTIGMPFIIVTHITHNCSLMLLMIVLSELVKKHNLTT